MMASDEQAMRQDARRAAVFVLSNFAARYVSPEGYDITPQQVIDNAVNAAGKYLWGWLYFWREAEVRRAVAEERGAWEEGIAEVRRAYAVGLFRDVTYEQALRANGLLAPVGLCIDNWSAAGGRTAADVIEKAAIRSRSEGKDNG